MSLYGFIGVVLSVLAYERERDTKAILQNSAEFFELLFIFLAAASMYLSSLILKERVIVVISVHSSDIPAHYNSCRLLQHPEAPAIVVT